MRRQLPLDPKILRRADNATAEELQSAPDFMTLADKAAAAAANAPVAPDAMSPAEPAPAQ